MYRIECMGCSTVFRFRSMERIGARVRRHDCVSGAVSHSVDHATDENRDIALIDSWAEVPAFADECQEVAYWATHRPSAALLETFR
jgi:hypothetical protein